MLLFIEMLIQRPSLHKLKVITVMLYFYTPASCFGSLPQCLSTRCTGGKVIRGKWEVGGMGKRITNAASTTD